MSLPAGLLLGFLADRLLGDPSRLHPVAGFGQLAARMERQTYRDARVAGAVHTLTLVAGASLAGLALDRAARRSPSAHTVAVAISAWAVLGGRTLEREAAAMHALLDANDLCGARRRVRSLVGRDPSALEAPELARAVIESVAENTSDAVVAPLLAGAVAGPAGLLGYRALNTLDAMIGHHTPRYEHFGWAAARADDAANWIPARLAAVLASAAAPLVHGRSGRAWRTVRRDAWQHPSPNAGQVEAAFAGALNVSLGGSNTYGERVEDRGTLGDGPGASVDDIGRAARLSLLVSLGAAGVAVAVAWVRGRVWKRVCDRGM